MKHVQQKKFEEHIARTITTSVIVQDWLAQQVSRQLGGLYAELELLTSNPKDFFKAAYDTKEILHEPAISFAETFHFKNKGSSSKLLVARKGDNRRVLTTLSYKEPTIEPVGIKVTLEIEGENVPIVEVKAAGEQHVKYVDGLKVLQTIFPPEQFPLLGKDVVEGRVDVLALFAERFPESVGEMINRAEHIGPTVQKELNEIFTTTTQKMERPHVLARIEELRPLFKHFKEPLQTEYLAKMAFEEIKNDFFLKFHGYKENVGQGEFRFFEPTINEREHAQTIEHFRETRL